VAGCGRQAPHRRIFALAAEDKAIVGVPNVFGWRPVASQPEHTAYATQIEAHWHSVTTGDGSDGDRQGARRRTARGGRVSDEPLRLVGELEPQVGRKLQRAKCQAMLRCSFKHLLEGSAAREAEVPDGGLRNLYRRACVRDLEGPMRKESLRDLVELDPFLLES